MWIVTITKAVPVEKNDFRVGFFPRTVRLKEQAEALQREVRFKGGNAHVGRVDTKRVRRSDLRPVD